jgi:hypothetical protein
MTTPSLVYARPFVNEEVEGTFTKDNIDYTCARASLIRTKTKHFEKWMLTSSQQRAYHLPC